MAKNKIMFEPYSLDTDPNSYIGIIQNTIKLAKNDVEIKGISIRKDIKDFFRTDYFWLNWYENTNNISKYEILKEFITKTIKLFFMWIAKGKLFVVVHNKQPHETVWPIINLLLMRIQYLFADRIIVLCEDGIEVANSIAKKNISKKIVKIHHPGYNCTNKKYILGPSQKFTVLFLGFLRPYKNVELVMELALKHPEMSFIIGGKPIDDNYRSKLESKASKINNLILKAQFIEDEEMNELMDKSDVLLLPYNLKSSMNSGMAMYALSKGLQIIIPKIGTIKELQNADSVFSFTDDNTSEYIEQVEKSLMAAYNLYHSNFDEYVARIEIVQQEVKTRFGIDTISKEIKQLLDL